MSIPTIRVSFLGEGKIFLDEKQLHFPYMRARLLLFALLETRKWARERLCEALWGDSQTARANLRNALSALRRMLPPDCILADRRNVQLREAFPIHSDLDELKAGAIGEDNVGRLMRPFLEDLIESGLENAWVEGRREHYRKRQRYLLAQKIEAADPEEKSFWRVRLSSLEGPSVLESTPVPTPPPVPPFVRLAERESVLAFLDAPGDEDFAHLSRCAFIFGEEGSGKSALAAEIYKRKKSAGVHCFWGRSLEGQGGGHRHTLWGMLRKIIGGRPLSELELPPLYLRYLTASFPELQARDAGKRSDAAQAPALMDLNPYLLGKIFALLFDWLLFRSKGEILLLLEDAHWADRWMPQFLRGLLENAHPPMAVLLTGYPEFRKMLDPALQPVESLIKRQDTVLTRLSIEQTEQICRTALPADQFSQKKLLEIYAHTDGSPFLLSEFLSFYDSEDWTNRLEKSLSEIVHRRILSLTEEEADLLDCVAAFPGEAPFDPLRELSGLSDNALTRLYESLHRKGMLNEQISGEGGAVLFRYSLIKKQVREQMSRLKWWNLHKRMLAYYKAHDDGPIDRRHLPLIAHHAGDRMTELAARIQELKVHFEFNHELFPKLSDGELFGASRNMNDSFLTGDFLRDARDLLNGLVRIHGRTPELIHYERTILTLEGGYFRWNGDYDESLGCLEEALKIAFQAPNREKALTEVLEQICYLGIQKDDPKLLTRYVYPFYRSAQQAHLHPQVGMALRFLAVLNIMGANYEAAEKLLKMSLRLYERLEAHGTGYMLSAIAATHYHGDIALHKGRHEEAFGHYMQCARLCEGKGFYRGLGLHLAKAAWCAVRLGRADEARELLAFARPLFEGFQSRRGAGLCGGEIVFGLSALFNLWDGMYQQARENLLYAEELGGVMQKPLWNAILYCVKALLCECDHPLLRRILPHEAVHYLEMARSRFDALGLPGEICAYEQLRRP